MTILAVAATVLLVGFRLMVAAINQAGDGWQT